MVRAASGDLERALNALCGAVGLTWDAAGSGVRLSSSSVTHEVDLIWAPRVSESDLAEFAAGGRGRQRLVITRELGAAALRSAAGMKVQVADLGGNGHLDLPGLLVHVEGRRVPNAAPRAVRTGHVRLLYALLRSRGPVERGLRHSV